MSKAESSLIWLQVAIKEVEAARTASFAAALLVGAAGAALAPLGLAASARGSAAAVAPRAAEAPRDPVNKLWLLFGPPSG